MKKIIGTVFTVLVSVLSSYSQSCGFSCNAEQEALANAQLNAYILATQANLGYDLNTTCSNIEQGQAKLPIVFHLIYSSGTSSGTSSNWSDTKVRRIITQLNELFAHVSGATFSNQFSGSNIEFEFVLAQRDPLNNPTNGIVRHITSNYQSVGMSTDTPMKTAYNWDPHRYINVYVIDDVIGAAAYALFPSFHGGVRDGLVVDGGSGSASLMTHELGHYFGLYHTFQGGCSNGDCTTSGDWVCDTPPKSTAGLAGGSCGAPSNSCSTDDDDTHDHNPLRPIGLGGIGDQVDALENYMDYTGGCYGAFTQGQRERMRATLYAIRSSLINENVYLTTVPDVALETIIFPVQSLCNKLSDVRIEIKNNGNTPISNIPLSLEVNGVGKKNITYSGTLASGAVTTVVFSDILFNDGINSIIVYTDWNLDGVSDNNMICSSTTYETPILSSTINANFESSMGDWYVNNPDNLATIAPFDLSICGDNGNKVLAYESLLTAGSGSGNNDYLISKTIDLTDATSATISFDYSYKNFYSNLQTHLSLEASDDCGESYTVLDSKTSFALNTTVFDRVYTPYYPASCSDWDTEIIDLSTYLGKEVTLRFNIELEGSQGQNLFLDNINVDITRNNIPDCNGDIGGGAKIDACGVCSGGLTTLVPNATCVDCNNEVNGTASLDLCGTCSGGSTNIVANSLCTDCNGDINGAAIIDGCGECTGGNTGISINSGCIDCAGIPGGSAIIDSCGVCSGGITGNIINSTCLDCNGDPNGTAHVDACGTCAGGRTGIIPDAACKDCNGELNGTASIDLCGICSGGNSGIVANTTCKDCNGDINGTATVDACGVCSGGNTNITPNSTCTDCNGELNGTAVLDACGSCAGGSTGITPDNSCINAGGCETITIKPGVFCASNSSVELIANSTSGSCNNLKWYNTATSSAVLETGCIFTTPNLNAERSYYVEDNVNINTPSNSGNFITGFGYTSSGLSNFQSSGLNTGQYVRFIANENTILKSVQVHFADCNNFTRFRVRLDRISGSGTSQSKTITPGCNTGSPTTLNLDFDVEAGTQYHLYISNLEKNQSGNWQQGNGSFRYHQQMSNSFSSYFSASKMTLQSINGYQGTGPFYNWTFASTCPRTEVKVFQNCFDECGNGKDDDNDGQIDEGCVDFSCNGRLLQTLGSTLWSINISPFQFDSLTTLPWGLNATAYNPIDNKVYATIGQGGEFIRIDANGDYEYLGFSRKPDGTPIRTWAADIGSDGTYYVLDNPERILYTLDLETMLATPVTGMITGASDIAYNPNDGMLYGVTGGSVIRIDPVGGTSTNIGNIQGIPGMVNAGAGAVYFTPKGELIAYGFFVNTTNQQDDLVLIDLATLQGTLINVDGIVTSNNDGASCPYSISMEKSVNVTAVLPGEEFEYTIDILNASAFNVSNANFIDVLPEGLSVTSVITNDLGALSNDISTRPDIIEIQNITLPTGNSTLKFSVQAKPQFICDSIILPNQAILSNLPATLGTVVVSDNPMTFAENDTTFVTINPNVNSTLFPGHLSSVRGDFCEMIQDTLVLTGSTGDLTWQYSTDSTNWGSFSGTILNDTTIVVSVTNTSNSVEDHYYRARLTSACDTQVTIVGYHLAPKTPRPIVTNRLFCLNDLASPLSAIGTNIKWYTGGTFVSTGPTPLTTNDGVISYYVTQTLNGCESEPSIQDVIITDQPTPPSISPFNFCKGEPNTTLGLQIPHLIWYETLTDVTPAFEEPTIDFERIQDTTFYVSYLINGCESDKAPLNIVVENCGCDLNANLIGQDSSMCIGDSVSYFISVSGSVNLPYTVKYVFTTSLSTHVDSITNINADGIYSLGHFNEVGVLNILSVYDNDCSITINDSVIISNYPDPLGDLSALTPHCALDSNYIYFNFTAGTSPFNIIFSSPSGTTINLNGVVDGDSLKTMDNAGTYKMTRIADDNGCQVTLPQNRDSVIVYPYPDATIATSEDSLSYCAGNDIALIQGTQVGGASYQWYKDGIVLQSERNIDLNNITKGEYRFEVRENGCVSLSDSLIVYELPTVIPNVMMGVDNNPVCKGRLVTFMITDSTGAGTNPIFEWYINGVVEGIDDNRLERNDLKNNDSVAVVITSNEMCPAPITDTASLVLTINDCPFDFFVDRDTICVGKVVNYTISVPDLISGDSLFWDFGIGAVPIDMNPITKPAGIVYYSPTNSLGPIEVVYTSIGQKDITLYKNGSVPDTLIKTAYVDVFGYPSATIATLEDSLSYCIGNDIEFIQGVAVAGSSYQWYKNGVAIPLEINLDLSNITQGEYRIEVNNNGCISLSDSLIIYELPVVTPSISIKANKDTICPGEDVLYEINTITYPGDSPIWEWKLNNTVVGIGNNVQLRHIRKGDSVSISMTTSHRCQTHAITLSRPIFPIVRDTLIDLKFISGQLKPCVNQKGIQIQVSSLGGAYTWGINTGDAHLINHKVNFATIDVGEINTDLDITVQGICNNVNLILKIEPQRYPDLILYDDLKLCKGLTDSLYVIDQATSTTSYDWYFNDQYINTADRFIINNQNQVGTYYVIGTNGSCLDTSNSVTVNILDPLISLSATPEWLQVGETTQLEVSSNVDSIIWATDNFDMDLSNHFNTKTIHSSPEITTKYEVSAIWGTCIAHDTILIRVVNPVGVPYFFSPNNDHDNDEWVIDDIGEYSSYSIEIYNRWGNVVRSYFNNYIPWDGKNENDTPLPDGTYFYIIQTSIQEKEVSITGHVSIIR